MTTKELSQTTKPYRPPARGNPDCGSCEKAGCPNRGKFQRDRRDFTVTSGRCPRLPDELGEYDPGFYDLQDADDAALERLVRILLRRGDSLQDVKKALNIIEAK